MLRRRANARNVSTSFLPYGGITYFINSFDYPNLLCCEVCHTVQNQNQIGPQCVCLTYDNRSCDRRSTREEIYPIVQLCGYTLCVSHTNPNNQLYFSQLRRLFSSIAVINATSLVKCMLRTRGLGQNLAEYGSEEDEKVC